MAKLFGIRKVYEFALGERLLHTCTNPTQWILSLIAEGRRETPRQRRWNGMGLHYDLVLALLRQSNGEVPITRIVGVGMGRIDVEFEGSRYLPARGRPNFTAPLPPKGVTPDLIVTLRGREKKRFAIELETGIPFVDVGKTLRQVKKYSELFEVVVLIMPKEAERYAPIFKNEGICVYLWMATREYQCLKCKKYTTNDTSIKPHCSECNSSERALRYVGIKDATFEGYKKPLSKPFKDRT